MDKNVSSLARLIVSIWDSNLIDMNRYDCKPGCFTTWLCVSAVLTQLGPRSRSARRADTARRAEAASPSAISHTYCDTAEYVQPTRKH